MNQELHSGTQDIFRASQWKSLPPTGWNGTLAAPLTLTSVVSMTQKSSLASSSATSIKKQPLAKSSISKHSTLLHGCCQQFPQNRVVVKAALDQEPRSAGRRATITATPEKNEKAIIARSHVTIKQGNPCARKEPFTYPLNIALNHNASFDVLTLLVCAAPKVLAQQDGTSRLCSLALALIRRPQDTRAIELILTIYPQAVATPDRRQNLPLHIACQKACPLPVVRQLHALFPDAVRAQNNHGETPLVIAQRNSKCSEEVLNFLQEA